MSDLIDRQAAIDMVKDVCDAIMSGCDSYYDSETDDEVYKDILEVDAILKCNKEIRIALKNLLSAEPERVWTPCDIPPKHHRDVIVRGVEAIGGECVYKVMQWDVDTWRPKNYAPSITWLDWSEI